ncbi:uncharacterized protein LOC136753381 isoform X2 [Amia ocellicauda]|uniref:uncharacterized protein LOC136753381 isoform X2 n=1 Tax=Amia ocellicauda TaxID=2972642 RepID=UPI00346499BF
MKKREREREKASQAPPLFWGSCTERGGIKYLQQLGEPPLPQELAVQDAVDGSFVTQQAAAQYKLTRIGAGHTILMIRRDFSFRQNLGQKVAIPLKVAEQLLTIAYENGVNVFDTAEVYAAGKAEIILGNIIKKKNWRIKGLPSEAAAGVRGCCLCKSTRQQYPNGGKPIPWRGSLI